MADKTVETLDNTAEFTSFLWRSKTGKIWKFNGENWGYHYNDGRMVDHIMPDDPLMRNSGPFTKIESPHPVTYKHGEPVEVDMVNHPPHYTRGPQLDVSGAAGIDPGTIVWTLECIDVIRWIKEPRLFTAMKYLWRVAFGGKGNDREDIEKAIWYLRDWLDNPT